MRSKAFTLIELLVVVAIIAILAAIALPNLLEMQVRAKVGRTRNDLRVTALAIESYAVDHNRYPPYGTLSSIVWAAATEGQILEPSWVTTPIAYLSSDAAMKDPFRTQGAPDSFAIGEDPDRRNYYFRLYQYANWDDVRYGNTAAVHERYGSWRLTGAGPDEWFFIVDDLGKDGGIGNFQICPYDASNGTVSRGDVIRCHKTAELHETYLIN